MSKYFESYFNYMRSNGKSENSIKTYRSDVSSLEKFLNTKGMSIDNNIADLTFEIMMEFKVLLHSNNLKPNTINRRFRMLKKFFKYMINMKIVEHNCCEGIEDTSVPKRNLVIPTKSEISAVLEKLDDKIHEESNRRCNEYLSVRNKLIVGILSRSGLRNEELRILKLENINMNGSVNVIGKGNKERVIFLGNKLMEGYKEYLKVRKAHLEKYNKESDLVFISYRCNMISNSDLNNIIKEAKNISGVKTLSKPHVLRHYTATTMLAKTKNLTTVKEILGHENISTTQIYLHCSNDDIKEAMQDD